MAGRPAGFSDEEFDGEDDWGYGDGGYYENSAPSFQPPPEQAKSGKRLYKDPWSQPPQSSDGGAVPSIKMDILTFRQHVENGDVDELKRFLVSPEGAKNKAKYLNQNVRGVWGSRPAFLAAENGRHKVLKLLMDEGASLEQNKEDGVTLLMAICAANPPFAASQLQFEDDLLECARIVLKNAGKGDCKDVNAAQSQNMTSLMMASRQGYGKLVELLIGEGAKLDAVDTQRWTALCFAVDRNHGHVARTLLEAGADPDVVTLDGQMLVDLVPPKNQILAEIVEAFAKRKKSLIADDLKCAKDKRSQQQQAMMLSVDGYKKFTELENVLLGIDATDYLSLFEKHQLNLEHFLSLNEADLEKIGVDKVGVRKKMLQAICEMHKRDWDKSSLPKIQPRDRMKGIYFTCPDGVMMVANLDRHLAFLTANLKFLKKNVDEHPELLRLGQDVADVKAMMTHVRKAKASAAATANQLRLLEKTLDDYTGDPNFSPADRVAEPFPNVQTAAKKILILAHSVILPLVAYKAIRYFVGK